MARILIAWLFAQFLCGAAALESPAVVDFGVHGTDPGTVVRVVAIRNTDPTRTLQLFSVTPEGRDSARFSVQGFSEVLLPGQQETLSIQFDPAGESGCWSANLRIESNDPGAPQTTLSLLAAVRCTPASPRPPRASAAPGTFAESFSLTLTAPNPDATIIYTTDGTAPSWDHGRLYTGPIAVSGTTLVRTACAVAGQLGDGMSFGYIKLAPALRQRTSPLPILLVENFGAGPIPDKGWTTAHQTGAGLKQRPRQPVLLSLHDRDPGSDRTALLGASRLSKRAGIRVRGAFSTTWNPKPYSFETWNESDTDQEVSLLGMPEESDWLLYHPHPSYDATMIFNTFIWELSRQTGRWAPQFRYVEVYVNEDGGDLDLSDRRGLYVLVEEVKRELHRVNYAPLSADGSAGGWMHTLNRMDPEPENGFPAPNGATSPQFFRTAGPNRILETRANVATWLGDDLPRQYNCFINFEDPNGYQITPAQRAAIEGWFRTFEDALYDDSRWRDPENGYRRHLDTRDFIDYFQLLNLARQGDGLLLSMFPWVSSDDRRLRMGPMWDFNNGAYHLSGPPAGTLYFRQTELWYPRLFADPEFLNEYVDRWFEMRRGPYANANLIRLVDEQSRLITAEMADAQGLSTATWNGRLTSMKNFLTQRADWIDSQYLSPPTISPASGVHGSPFTVTLANTAPESGTLYYTLDGRDPRSDSGTPQGTAYTGAFTTVAPAVIRARMRSTSTGRWSALNTSHFFTAAPASPSNLVVSEIHYNPSGSRDVREFVEVMNTSDQPLDLTGAQFDSGIRFSAAVGTTLAPGERAIIAAASQDFPSPGPRVLGIYGPGSTLDNRGGLLRMRAWDGAVIQEFIWNDAPPWPTTPDGDGPSLTLLRPETHPDPALPQHWRASVVSGGTPGGTDATAFTGDPEADDDSDGIPNLAEYALDSLPPQISSQPGEWVWMIPINPAAEDVSLEPEWSSDLEIWQPAGPLFESDRTSDSTRLLQSPSPPGRNPTFLRLRIERR